MSTAQNQPAAPLNELDQISGQVVDQHKGLTAREHAAIALRVPDSGNDWLDAMIRTAQRNDLAARALATIPAYASDVEAWEPHHFAGHAYAIADAMLPASAAHSAEGE